MKKKVFDRKLYLEGLKQTRSIGITLAIMTIIPSVIFPLFNFLETLTGYFDYDYVWQLDITNFAPLLLLFLFFAPLLLSLRLFSFLNKRNGSDFYHALPCTRSCLFISFSASILTWLAGTILTTVFLNGVVYALDPNCVFSWMFVPYCFFTYFFGALLITAIMLLAKSLTGTLFSNIAVACLILYFPRILISVFDNMLVNMTYIIEPGTFGFLSDYSYNIPVQLSVEFLFGGYGTIKPSFFGGIIYTFILALVYFAIAFVLYQKTKSETAQQAAAGKWMQHALRCFITIPVTLVFLSILQDVGLGFFGCFLFVFLTLLVYFTYELITTKKAKNLLKAIPAFSFVILFDILFCLSLFFAQNVILRNVPDVNKIESVGIQFHEDFYYETHYNKELVKDYYVKDAQLEKLVAQALEETVASVKDGTYIRKLQQSEQYLEYPVSIKKNNGTILQRNIIFAADQVAYAQELYEKEKSYQEKLVKLPDDKTIRQITVESARVGMDTQVWKLFCKEYNLLSNVEKQRVNGINNLALEEFWEKEQKWLNITVYGFIGIDGYRMEYQIDKEQFPETYAYCLNLINQRTKEGIDLFWEQVNKGKNENYGYEIWFGSADDLSGNMFECFIGKEEANLWGDMEQKYFSELPEDFQVLKAATSRPVTVKEPIFELNVQKHIVEGDFFYMDALGCGKVYFNLTAEEYEVLKKYLQESLYE